MIKTRSHTHTTYSNRSPLRGYHYRAFGLAIQSAVALPELLADSTAPEVTIAEGLLHDVPDIELTQGKGVAGGGEDIYLRFASVGTFRIRHGTTVTVERVPDADEASVRICLTGPVLGALLHQRRMVTLHASAVVINDGAVAFMAPSGAGKSSTAAALQACGHTLLADDVVALTPDFGGGWLVQPAIPRLKLRPDLSAALDLPAAQLKPFHPAERRRQLHVDSGFATTAAPLRRIYVLEDGPELGVELLGPAEAMIAITSHSYALRILGATGATDVAFRATQRLAMTTPVFRLTRPRRLESLAETIRFLQAN